MSACKWPKQCPQLFEMLALSFVEFKCSVALVLDNFVDLNNTSVKYRFHRVRPAYSK